MYLAFQLSPSHQSLSRVLIFLMSIFPVFCRHLLGSVGVPFGEASIEKSQSRFLSYSPKEQKLALRFYTSGIGDGNYERTGYS